MNKILLVIQREYLTRVKKKSFIVMTFLGPLLMSGIFVSAFLLDKVDTEVKKIGVIDNTHIFVNKFKDNERVKFEYLNEDVEKVRSESKNRGYFGVLVIPATENLSSLEKAVTFYSESQPGFDIISKIKFTIEKEINTQKYISAGIDESKLLAIKTDVNIQTRDLENKETSTPLTTGLGFAAGLLIYLFIFIYGAMVMRGVLEEKTSRIVEVIISSVKPFQLMMGKIVGVALVGLTQFLLWVILSSTVFFALTSSLMSGKSDKEKAEMIMKSRPGMEEAMQQADEDSPIKGDKMMKLDSILGTINFPLLIGMFIFYFLGGYLLYSALFAAIGAAVDSETDTQQFMLPVTIPLIIAYVAAATVINNPQGNVAFWFSVIPFTSPIVMMVRIPFGVPWEHIVLSMVLLIAGFIFTTWIAARIYRVGILMYGKKVTYKELWKWLRFQN
ncbi:MAG: ABC transporter permease [Bacteroidetes bacterium]|jgi:ABC-2 type transport system permease protein|nr:ABC transporter permease [Bacteroidota bacterium]MBP6426489.1 ABC transporter permease [Bacteroidia bacterium]MBK8363475.1 ABC transporter permease [Bacteroidota bacterium]MBK9414759.1 ABC transporter permease [Bacteroidota bacterium]MBL0033344.1 ABC transporter permease [Bacteroidota bacterium]